MCFSSMTGRKNSPEVFRSALRALVVVFPIFHVRFELAFGGRALWRSRLDYCPKVMNSLVYIGVLVCAQFVDYVQCLIQHLASYRAEFGGGCLSCTLLRVLGDDLGDRLVEANF